MTKIQNNENKKNNGACYALHFLFTSYNILSAKQ